MKERNGWVSNSSSSSFLIYGVYLSDETLKKYIGDDQDDDHLEDLCKKTGDKRIVYYSPYDTGRAYIGASPDKIRDDETGGQFKASVEKAIRELFKDENLKFGYHQEAWYNG